MKRAILVFTFLPILAFAGEIGRKRAYEERIQSEFGITEYPAIGSCRFRMLGRNLPEEMVYEDDLMDKKTCLAKGASLLENNRKGYTQVFVKHQSTDKWELFEKK